MFRQRLCVNSLYILLVMEVQALSISSNNDVVFPNFANPSGNHALESENVTSHILLTGELFDEIATKGKKNASNLWFLAWSLYSIR